MSGLVFPPPAVDQFDSVEMIAQLFFPLVLLIRLFQTSEQCMPTPATSEMVVATTLRPSKSSHILIVLKALI
jgi:hypothetical protein